MFRKDPILIKGPLGRIYAFTLRYQGNNLFDGPRLAFPHDRAYARDYLLQLARGAADDPFNYRLLDVWQLVFQKPWTRPASLFELVSDLTAKIHRGELFVYLEPDPYRIDPDLLASGPPQGDPPFLEIGTFSNSAPTADRPRVSGPVVPTNSSSWGEDYAAGLSDSATAIATDISSEQTELYENTSGWGNVMYPLFKPVENFGRLIGNTVGLMSGLSPNGMNPKVAEYWKGIGDSVRALGNKVADAVGGDGRAAGEMTPAVASILVSKKLPDKTPELKKESGGTLIFHENLDGHTIRRHVGKTDEQLLQRLMDDPDILASSTYPDLETAQRAVGAVLTRNSQNVNDWMVNSPRSRLVLSESLDHDIGRVVLRGETVPRSSNKAFVLLVKDSLAPEGYRVHTSYPMPNAD